MILVGNTTHEVRAFLTTKARTELSRRRTTRIPDESLDEICATSRQERALFGIPCPCGAKEWLCIGLTGLPASGPHAERIR